MKGSLAAFGTLLLVLSTHALKLPFQRRDTLRGAQVTSPNHKSAKKNIFNSNSNQLEPLGNINDYRYVTNITINEVEVQVAIDTGSTDLWVIPPGGIGDFNDTGIEIELLYGDGTYGTKGTVGVSPFQFGSYQVERQAFLNAVTSTIGAMADLGIYGLLGLSFDFSTASPINRKIKSLYGNDATWGRSVLQNIFAQNASQPNFIALDLSRTDDLEDTDGGSFTIGEYDDAYAAVADKPKLPQYPKGGDRWTVLLEGITVDGTAITVHSTIPGVPAGSAQALLDTGDPTAIFPVAIYDAIYSHIPGAALYEDGGNRAWIIPCNTTTQVDLQFGGEKYNMHPLDLSEITDATVDGQPYTVCISSFMGMDDWGQGDFDLSLGDTFLRNVYSVFDFGDTLPDGTTGEPYMQLLSEVDAAKAAAQVASIRGKTLATLPPEMDPATLIGLLGGSATVPTPTASDVIGGPTTTDSTKSTSTSKANSLAAGHGNNVYDNDTVKHYGLIVIGLLGANLLIGLVLIAFAVVGCIRRGTSRKAASRNLDYAPVKNVDLDQAFNAPNYQKRYSQ